MKRRSSANPEILIPPSIDRVRKALGHGRYPQPPEHISQKAFDYDDAHLHRLADPSAEIDGRDVLNYALDLKYETIQAGLFAYAFPRVLEIWRRSIGFDGEASAAIGELHSALCRRMLPPPLIGGHAGGEILAYMTGSLLEAMDAINTLRQSQWPSSCHTLFDYLAIFGVYAPDIGPFLDLWWTLETPGRCRAALQWISCLVYDDNSNPVWQPWSADAGGGPPRLWMDNGMIFGVGWTPQNAERIQTKLTTEFIGDRAAAASGRLADTNDAALAEQVSSDLRYLHEVVRARLDALPSLLISYHEPSAERSWPA